MFSIGTVPYRVGPLGTKCSPFMPLLPINLPITERMILFRIRFCTCIFIMFIEKLSIYQKTTRKEMKIIKIKYNTLRIWGITLISSKRVQAKGWRLLDENTLVKLLSISLCLMHWVYHTFLLWIKDADLVQCKTDGPWRLLICVRFNLKVMWRHGVIQLTCGVRSSVWSGFKPSHGSITARVEVSIS